MVSSVHRRSFVGLLSTLFLPLGAVGAASPLELRECNIEAHDDVQIGARCASLSLPENPLEPSGRRIQLAIALIPATRDAHARDPLFVIAGGPGRGAADYFSKLHSSFARVNASHDIVLVDQRGTGLSNRLDCHFAVDADFEGDDYAHVQDQAEKCLGELRADPRFYTTSIAVRDLDAVRAALGYDRVNLYGVSYGSRVAQHYLRRYPQHVRALVLDGAVPADVAVGPDIATQGQRALDGLFTRCSSDADCSKRFGGIHATFAALYKRVQREPIRVEVTDPISNEAMHATLGPAQLSAAVRRLSYADETASLLPLLIHRAQVEERPEALIAQYLRIQSGQTTDIAYGMHLSVACSEDAPRWDVRNVEQQSAQTYLGSTFMNSLSSMCAVWPRGVVDWDFHAPLRSDKPLLVLSGENDPVTPVEYGARVARGFANGRHLVLRGQGHGQMTNPCAERIVTEFLDEGSNEQLDVSCVVDVEPTPFALVTVAQGE